MMGATSIYYISKEDCLKDENKKKAKRKKPGNTPTSHVITNRNTIGAQRGLNALC